MEKNNTYKIVSVVALVVAVIALSVGFATYSATLTISSSATVVPGDEFSPNVNFVSGTPNCVPSGKASVISNGSASEKAWSGIDVQLVEPGDYVTCTASVQNASIFDAYLKQIAAEAIVSCDTVGTSNPASDYADACDGIEIDSSVATYTVSADNTAVVGTTESILRSGDITGVSIAAKNGDTISSQEVSIVIRYKTGSAKADGDFNVNIPTISVLYKTEE